MTENEHTILVLDDDPAVRRVVARFLRGAGYEVLEAGSGAEAVTAGEGHPGRLDLLVADVLLPRRNGVQVARELTRQRPGLRVLFMSGRPAEDRVRYGAIEPGYHFVQKPLDREAFLARVAEILRE